MAKNKAKQRVYLNEDEKKVLAGLLDEWNSKPDKKTWDSFISSEALYKIQQLNPLKYGPDIISRDKEAKKMWEGRVQAVYTWFKNNKPYKDRAVFKLERKIPLRRIVGKLKANEIHEVVVAANPEVEKGDKNYPGHFQKGLTAIMKALTTEEMEDMERIREEWQNAGPPIDVRLKAAKKYSRKGIINAHQLLQKEMYVSCITFSFNPEADTGVMAVVCHDYIADLHAKTHGKKFKTFKEWNSEGYARIVQDVIGYANYVDQQRKDKTDVETESVSINFEKGPGNLPLLPAEVKGVKGVEIAKNAREIIRAYFLRHYQLATGCESVRTPWAIIGENPSNFFDNSCIPSDFKFQDPSRMGINVKALLNHLRERQKELGVNAFKFHHIYRNNKLEPAEYPKDAQAVMGSEVLPSGMDERGGTSDALASTRTPTKTKRGSRSPTKTPHAKRNKKSKGKSKSIQQTPESVDSTGIEDTNHTTTKGTENDGIGNTFMGFDTSPNVIEPNIPNPYTGTTPPVPFPIQSLFPAATTPTDASGFPTIHPNSLPPPFLQNGQLLLQPPTFPIQELMSYMLQHIGEKHIPRSGTGYNFPEGQADVSFGNIDPQLLPTGPPPFSTQHFNSLPYQPQVPKELVNANNGIGFAFIPPTASVTPLSNKRTPKRKISEDNLEAEVTPSRSNRKRKPTQKLLDSMEMGNI